MNTQKYFGTDNLYEILGVDANARISEGKTYLKHIFHEMVVIFKFIRL